MGSDVRTADAISALHKTEGNFGLSCKKYPICVKNLSRSACFHNVLNCFLRRGFFKWCASLEYRNTSQGEPGSMGDVNMDEGFEAKVSLMEKD